ncbi:MAG: RIP metalloprotease RseP [Tissierellia bacterium]|nr:RIP metalloprotease RseP [Tissierellia bacterium]
MLTAVSAIFVFLIVILFHEFGHFIVAKTVGIKVNEFSIGMGPKFFQKERGETKYSIRILPIGGYVSMEGEDEGSSDPRSFNRVPVLSRIAVISAGAIMNFILAIIVFSIVVFSLGMPTTTIQNVQPDSPAERIGIQNGDAIVRINDKPINDWDSIVERINSASPDKELKVTIMRDEKELDYSLQPTKGEDDRTIIGIEPVLKKSFLLSIKGGVEQTLAVLKMMFGFLRMALRGQVSTRDLSGPVGVIYTIGEAAKYGIVNLLYLMGFISVNLGFFNLLPLPALDGSRIIFLIIEMIRGKAINPEKEGFIHFIGFVLLILLMLIVTYSDIIRFNIFKG